MTDNATDLESTNGSLEQSWDCAAAYDAHAAGVFTYALRALHDHDEAADVVYGTFVLADRNAWRRQTADELATWLYALCRRDWEQRLDGRPAPTPVSHRLRGEAPTDESLVELERELRKAELRSVNWPEADGLTPAHREVVELSIRHGLDTCGVARVLDISLETASVMLSRAWRDLDRSLAAAALLRDERWSCERFASLRRTHGTLTPRSLEVLSWHIEGCPRCQYQLHTVIGTPAAPASLPCVAPPTGLRAVLLDDLDAAHATTLPDPRHELIASRVAEFDRLGFPLRRVERAWERAARIERGTRVGRVVRQVGGRADTRSARSASRRAEALRRATERGPEPTPAAADIVGAAPVSLVWPDDSSPAGESGADVERPAAGATSPSSDGLTSSQHAWPLDIWPDAAVSPRSEHAPGLDTDGTDVAEARPAEESDNRHAGAEFAGAEFEPRSRRERPDARRPDLAAQACEHPRFESHRPRPGAGRAHASRGFVAGRVVAGVGALGVIGALGAGYVLIHDRSPEPARQTLLDNTPSGTTTDSPDLSQVVPIAGDTRPSRGKHRATGTMTPSASNARTPITSATVSGASTGLVRVRVADRSSIGPRVTLHLWNAGNAPVRWTASTDASYVSLSATSGTLAPGASQAVIATIDVSRAPAHWTAHVRFAPGGTVVTLFGTGARPAPTSPAPSTSPTGSTSPAPTSPGSPTSTGPSSPSAPPSPSHSPTAPSTPSATSSAGSPPAS